MTTYRCTALGTLPSGREWSFRMHFNSAQPIATVQNDWLAHLDGAWTVGASALQAIYPVNTVLQTAKTEQLAVVHFAGPPPVDKMRAVATRADNPALPGTSVNPAMNDNDAVLVSLRTGFPGREDRGRIRLPALDRTLVTASEFDAVTAGHISTAIIGVITNMAASGHTAVLVTYVQTHAGTPVGTTKNVSTAETDRIVRSIRQRSKRRKPVYV